MKVIDWLLEGDVVIQHLTTNYLLEKPFDHHDKGFIADYLAFYNEEEQMWGSNTYSNKWISSTYTLLELKYMEMSYDHPAYQKATEKVLNDQWSDHGHVKTGRYLDMCVAGMILSLVAYGRIQDHKVEEIIDYILEHQQTDGGWNCRWDAPGNGRSVVSSFHTTMSVLEGLADYEQYGYTYRLDEVKRRIMPAQEYLLKRYLFRSLRTGNVVKSEFKTFHYPPRWKYDCFRALEYFVKVDHVYDERMDEALVLVEKAFEKGYVGKGTTYPGKIYFPLEQSGKGRFNTFRGLRILKKYDHEAWLAAIKEQGIKYD